MYINIPDSMSPEHCSPGCTEPGQKLMVTGNVFKPDGKTPAPNALIIIGKMVFVAFVKTALFVHGIMKFVGIDAVITGTVELCNKVFGL
jgi:hypothetical protein